VARIEARRISDVKSAALGDGCRDDEIRKTETFTLRRDEGLPG